MMARRDADEQRARAIGALAVDLDPHRAAAAAGVSPRSVRRWLAQPEFQERLGLARLAAGTGRALETLQQLLDVEVPPDVRAIAAATWLDHVDRHRNLVELAGRLDRLEHPEQVAAAGFHRPDDDADELAARAQDRRRRRPAR